MPTFPPWTTAIRQYLPIVAGGGLIYVIVLVWYGFSPEATDVGYAPNQPVAFSHAVHAGNLGLDCRYCHNTVEVAARAAVPPTATCMNCHARIRAKSEKVALVRQSAATGQAIPWVRVHDLPDYVFFDHSAHVMRGVGCTSCHGRIDKMDVVTQVQPLNMGWCLECHRAPEQHLRPRELVTQMDYAADNQLAVGARIKQDYQLNPSQDCSTCHR